MSQKLAIAISGAVSLGSFESGVMYEIIEAIAQHNQHQETAEDQKIIIDVITGASAGADCRYSGSETPFEADRLRGPTKMTSTGHGWRMLISACYFSLR